MKPQIVQYGLMILAGVIHMIKETHMFLLIIQNHSYTEISVEAKPSNLLLCFILVISY